MLSCSILDLHARCYVPGSFCLAITYRHTEEVMCQLTYMHPILGRYVLINLMQMLGHEFD